LLKFYFIIKQLSTKLIYNLTLLGVFCILKNSYIGKGHEGDQGLLHKASESRVSWKTVLLRRFRHHPGVAGWKVK